MRLEEFVKIASPESELARLTEIDRVQLATGCPVFCSHCSRDPSRKLISVMTPGNFERYLDLLKEIEKKTGANLLTAYLLTDTDSDPFLNPDLAENCRLLLSKTGRRFYLLTSGLPFNSAFEKTARELSEKPDLIERIAITISHFPKLAETDLDRYIESLAKGVSLLKPLLDKGKLILSPQYNEEDTALHSMERTFSTYRQIIKRSGLKENDVREFTFPRPIIGLGRAETKLKVRKQDDYRIEAEQPSPVISIREKERPFSGMLTSSGVLMVCRAPRASLNASNWQDAGKIFQRRALL